MTQPGDDPLPVPPPRPTMDDCCRGGCDPCVFDLYDAAMERYEADLSAWQKRNDARLRSAQRPGELSSGR